MEVALNKIKLKKRIRKDQGNMDSLINSLKKHGLINPIAINSKYELLAGYRRLMAARKLKWKTIEVKVINVSDKLERLNIELEENIIRKDFTQHEMERGISMKTELLKIKNMHWFIRLLYKIYRAIALFFYKIFNIDGEL